MNHGENERKRCANPDCGETFELDPGRRSKPRKFCSARCAVRNAQRDARRRREEGYVYIKLKVPIQTVSILEKAFGRRWIEDAAESLDSIADRLVTYSEEKFSWDFQQ
jgi:hypothetical protein